MFDVEDFLAGGRDGRVLFTPTAHRSLSGWDWTRNHLILSVLDDVVTHLEVLTPGRGLGGAGAARRTGVLLAGDHRL